MLSVVSVMPSKDFAGLDMFFFRVLMLRRKASPTETELHVEYSHMVNEALEMIPAVEGRPGDISKGSKPPISTDDQAQP